MDETRLDGEVLSRVPMDRRQFVRRMIVTTAFATPVVASFTMDDLTLRRSAAAAASANSTTF